MATLRDVIVIRAADSGPEFVDVLLRNLVEAGFDQRGFSALATHTAQLLLAHVIRTYALADGQSEVSWLAGLDDTHLARALKAIHREPQLDWSVASLARAAGLSRSAFAQRFLSRTGKTPMEYLRSWRMQLAQEALANGDLTVTALTQNLGYRSEAAFREAFRQTTGQTPSEFRRQLLSLSPGSSETS